MALISPHYAHRVASPVEQKPVCAPWPNDEAILGLSQDRALVARVQSSRRNHGGPCFKRTNRSARCQEAKERFVQISCTLLGYGGHMEKWHEKARKRLADRGMLVKDLAELIGTTASGAGHYLSGRRHPKPGMLKNIAAALEMSLSELIEDDPDFARNSEEKLMLETLRKIPDEHKQAALAMLAALTAPPPSTKQ